MVEHESKKTKTETPATGGLSDLFTTSVLKEIFGGIVLRLDFTTLLSVPFVCKQWSIWAQDEAIWKQIAFERYPSLNVLSNDAVSAIESWKSLYTSRLYRDDYFAHTLFRAFRSVSNNSSEENVMQFITGKRRELKKFALVKGFFQPAADWSEEARFLIDGITYPEITSEPDQNEDWEYRSYSLKASMLGFDGKLHKMSFKVEYGYGLRDLLLEASQYPVFKLDKKTTFELPANEDLSHSAETCGHAFRKFFRECKDVLKAKDIELNEFWKFMKGYWFPSKEMESFWRDIMSYLDKLE